MSTPSLPAAVGFFAGLLEGEVVSEDDEAVELAWPGSGGIRLELDGHAPPGFRRVEGEQPDRTGAETLDVSGASFAISPG